MIFFGPNHQLAIGSGQEVCRDFDDLKKMMPKICQFYHALRWVAEYNDSGGVFNCSGDGIFPSSF
jgi:hypothetical protein